MTAGLACAVAALALASSVARAEDKPTAPSAPADLPALVLEAGKPLEITCATKAVNVSEETKASEGDLRLRLEVPTGAWKVVSVDAAHMASFAFGQREACGNGCPLDSGGEKALMLWAPSKTTPDKLDAGATLALASLDIKTWAIRVSTYRDKQIASLEHGSCKPAP